MKSMMALFWARNKEFFRDRGSLIWAFIMPPVIIAVVALAFSSNSQELFRIGLHGDNYQQLPDDFITDYIRPIVYDDVATGIQKVQHHQLDLFIDLQTPLRYWVNAESATGEVMEKLLLQAVANNATKEVVSGRAVRYVDWVIPGILGMNILFSGLFGIGFVIVRYRKNGVLKRLQASPVTALQFLSAQLLSRLFILLTVSIVVYCVANFFVDFIMLGNYWHLLLVALLGDIAILSIALLVAARFSSEEFVNGLLNLVSFPMLLLSEVWFSLDGAPTWLNQISQTLPLTHLVGAARDIMIDGAGLADISQHLIYLVVITLVCLTAAAGLFRWN